MERFAKLRSIEQNVNDGSAHGAEGDRGGRARDDGPKFSPVGLDRQQCYFNYVFSVTAAVKVM